MTRIFFWESLYSFCRIGNDQLSLGDNGIVEPFEFIIPHVIGRMASGHEMRICPFDGFKATPSRSATARMNDVDIVLADKSAKTKNVKGHDERVFAMNRQLDMLRSTAQYFGNPRASIGYHNSLHSSLNLRCGDIHSGLFGSPCAQIGNNLHNDWFFAHFDTLPP